MSPSNLPVQQAKQQLRSRIWQTLERHHVVEDGVTGYIPDFTGADRAAARLAATDAWQHAHTIAANPDRAQLAARALALTHGKTVYMAVPRLAGTRPFYLLDPTQLHQPPEQAALHQTAGRHAPTVTTDQMQPIDLIICGSVAVTPTGARLGKGAGYTDLEIALLTEAHLITDHTTIATTIHPLQLIHDPIPETPHDFPIDLIVTPDHTLTCPRRPRPTGLLTDHLTTDLITAIPALSARQPHRKRR
ncbi:5-formyltetrahydrofolate cyclo-ligase [Mangrovihabitans endophyticus]|uniref:5-formyltetrahydrofolate cyclo-ligase n=1 Tax=Mangrovihabitans endophyticus TaxID=1751298 RepID=A0A8J3FT63_9ACTN|nr:5-formyltetrahydrofolate cyclo-ligase [Mangrovihabitans endophyticus]GGL21123.1 hypothetical protein GCM10012284_64730 [Mangrovihabitans endophyticus]